MPKSTKHALELYKKNGNTYLSDAIVEEMKNVWFVFQILDENEPVTIG